MAAERRPATLEDLRALVRRPRPRAWLAPVIGLGAAVAVAAVAGVLAVTSVTAPLVSALAIAGALALAMGVVLVRRARARSRGEVTLSTVDPALAPAAPITEGDRLGGWVVLESSGSRMHVARSQGLAAFRLWRAGALVGSVAGVAGLVGLIVAGAGTGRVRAMDFKLALAALAGVAWAARFAVARNAYQWTLEAGGSEPELVVHDASLFGASRLVTVRPRDVAGFTATPRELRLVRGDGTSRVLAGLGGSPLAGWRASCIATTVAVMMGLKVSLTYEDEAKRVTSVSLPAPFAEDDAMAVSTTQMIQAEEAPEGKD